MRVSTTTLEQFRQYLLPDELTFVTEEDLVRTIKGIYKPGPEAEMGAAFDRILCEPQKFFCPDRGIYAVGGHEFSQSVVRPCLDVLNPAGIFQVKETATFNVGGVTVTVVAKVDQLDGAEVVENKTKWSTFDIEQYLVSMQWRFYDLIFRPAAVRYNVFLLSDTERNGITLRGIETFRCHRYPTMEAECADLLRRFVEFVKVKGLEGYLQPRGDRAA